MFYQSWGFPPPRKRACPPEGRGRNSDSRRTGGMGTGAVSRLRDGPGPGCLTLWQGAALFQWCQPYHWEPTPPPGPGELSNLVLRLDEEEMSEFLKKV